ncbi:MAG: hypothetical protein M3Z14_04635 [Candidatus Eremiobacteraeota bacterium]|nr:hypothetical protein [Candidatus Eremiobacteraeota bacterium]
MVLAHETNGSRLRRPGCQAYGTWILDNTIVPNTEVTVARLSTLRNLRTFAACALRTAMRGAVLYRLSMADPSRLRHAALESLDALIADLPVTTAERVRVRTQVAVAADGFARSRLGRRLLTMPVSRITASTAPSADLIVRDPAGRKYAIIFATQPAPLAFAQIAERVTRELPDCEAVFIYNAQRAVTRRFAHHPQIMARCA